MGIWGDTIFKLKYKDGKLTHLKLKLKYKN